MTSRARRGRLDRARELREQPPCTIPCNMRPPSTPPLWRFLREGSGGLLELPRLAMHFPKLRKQTRGSGQPVLVLPGFGTGDATTLLLRRYIGSLGYTARGWGLGINRGNVAKAVPKMIALARQLSEDHQAQVRLVGWSLGGVIAREVARENPELVSRVITLGSPVVGGAKYTVVGDIYERRGYDLDEMAARVEKRNRIPIRVPITAVYSRNDLIVAWKACLDGFNDDVEHIEVRASHIGLGFSPEVYQLIADRLVS